MHSGRPAGRLARVDYPALFQAEAERVLTAAAKDLDAPVPACPGWDCRRLVAHVGRLLASTATHLPRGVVDPPPFTPRPPAEDATLVAYSLLPALRANR